MRVATFYAECSLPPLPAQKSAGFNWHQAIEQLEASALRSLGKDTELVVVTDTRTNVSELPVRIGDARQSGIMLWLLDAQAEVIRQSIGAGPLLLVSPDTLIAGSLDMMFGDWDVCLLTRRRPKPIVNSVIAVRPGKAVAEAWARMARAARGYSDSLREWGVDIDVLVDGFSILPLEDTTREVDGVRVRLLPVDGIFQTVTPGSQPKTPIWDFKGSAKALMPAYARLL